MTDTREMRLRKRIDALTDVITNQEGEIARLRAQIRSLNGQLGWVSAQNRKRGVDLEKALLAPSLVVEKYETEQERVEARRASWRKSKQRKRGKRA